mmetsp:Transcript_15238/g.32864  ORF Transcript_15238/g.32864 Transcript_15238/m.32864 type:complete len:992 (-) Transcript_15238:870-3845(-)
MALPLPMLAQQVQTGLQNGLMGFQTGVVGNPAAAGSGVGAGAQECNTSTACLEVAGRFKAAGDVGSAAEKYYQAIRLDPNCVQAHLNLGNIFLAAGDIQRSLDHFEKAYQLDPRNPEASCGLGGICRAQAQFETAIGWYRAAVRLGPNLETAAQNLALCLVSHGLQIKGHDPKAAIKCYHEALVHSPYNANAYYNLGVLYAELGKHDKALSNYNLTVHFDPRCAEAYNNMGVIYKEQENLDKALKCYLMALQCNPRFAQTLNNLGVAYTTIGRLTEALEYLSRAVTVAPTYAEAYNNLGWLFWDHGDLAQALRMYERCIELSPSSKNPSQNRLLALNYLPVVDPERVYQAHCAWAERFCLELGPAYTEWPVARTVNKRLRIAYISPDYFHHSVSFFCHALFQYHNRELFEVFLYSSAAREDDKTELFKSFVPESHWRKVTGRPAREVAEMIRADQIDILVELAGHTANNRLDVAALKPAPVQFTYIGYNNTTGLGAIDYRITDAVVDPPESSQHFSEELVRMPGVFLCYTPPASIPDVETLPALKTGYVTFGSFSCLAKVTDPCVALWARVLREVPNSCLLVKNKGFYSPDVQQTFINKFKAHGIAEHRLKLLALAPTSFDHLKIYNEVDIALDTFPYSNTTTSCETLLMGVPVVCLRGNTHGSRVGVTLLSAIGMQDFVADTEEEYVQKAQTAAGNLSALAQLRSRLRQVLLSSQLCDGPGFVRDKFEPAILDKWRLFCEGRAPSVQVFSGPNAPDPLAPGPFAPPLPPGVPLVQCNSTGPAASGPSAGTTVGAPQMLGLGNPVAVPMQTNAAQVQAQLQAASFGTALLGQAAQVVQQQPAAAACALANLAAVAGPLAQQQAAAVAHQAAVQQVVQQQQLLHHQTQAPQPMMVSSNEAASPLSSPNAHDHTMPRGFGNMGAGGLQQQQQHQVQLAQQQATMLNQLMMSPHGCHNLQGQPLCSSNLSMLPGMQMNRRRPRARPQNIAGRRI